MKTTKEIRTNIINTFGDSNWWMNPRLVKLSEVFDDLDNLEAKCEWQRGRINELEKELANATGKEIHRVTCPF